MMVTGWDYFFLKRKPNRQFRCKEIHRKHSTRVNGPKDIMAIFCVFFLYMYFIQRRIEGRVDVVSCNRLLQNVYLYFFYQNLFLKDPCHISCLFVDSAFKHRNVFPL